MRFEPEIDNLIKFFYFLTDSIKLKDRFLLYY